MQKNSVKWIETDGKLAISYTLGNKQHTLVIDFYSDKSQQWLNSVNKKHPIYKSLGLNKANHSPYVIDATAGIGKDSLLIANFGAKVLMLEQSEILAKLLKNALQNLKVNTSAPEKIKNNILGIEHINSIDFFANLSPENYPDIVYLDPMFPTNNKTALVKKEMQLLQKIVTTNFCEKELFRQAQKVAKKRVVVKRPRSAPYLNNTKPNHSILSPSLRYDIYINLS